MTVQTWCGVCGRPCSLVLGLPTCCMLPWVKVKIIGIRNDLPQSSRDSRSDSDNRPNVATRLGRLRHLAKEYMRTLHDHETNEANRQIQITADEQDPDNGNASHVYEITRTETEPNTPWKQVLLCELPFQHGPIGESGVNGITNEVLLAIVADRLRCFQTSKYACRENALALTKIEEAASWLESRTKNRTRRNVEGTNKV